ncbi:MAG: hypothetical protein HYR85_03795 [Planctomycetes bacterium]|nr:hypothetical protein [Planctomycetota bacterium]
MLAFALAAALLLAAPRWDDTIPHALEAAGTRGLVAVYVTPSRDDLTLLEAERLLYEHPQFDEVASAYRWVRTLSYLEDAKPFHSEEKPAIVVVRPAGAAPGFEEVGRIATFDESDSAAIQFLRDTAKRHAPETIDASRDGDRSRLSREFAAARSGGDDATRRAFVAANPTSLYAAIIERDLAARAPAGDPPPRAVANVVRLVPDLSTFLVEIGEWDEGTFWPILMDGDHRNAAFIDAFAPAAVERVAPVRSAGVDEGAIRAAFVAALTPLSLDKARIAAPAVERLLPDLVVTQADAPEWPGALALAAGHRERLDFVEGIGERGGIVARADLERARALLRERLRDARFVTIAGRFALGYRDSTQAEKGDYALDDALLRDDRDLPLAFAGRLVGDAAQSIYQAMASLFLRPKSALFFSRYDTKSEPWSNFDPSPLAARLAPLFPTRVVAGEGATLAAWRKLVTPRSGDGLVYVNSSGGARDWSLAGGPGGDEMDVPLTTPAIVAYTHSGSAGNPYDVDSIAGRWLWSGAYVYFGSYREPFLDAFRTPRDVIERALDGTSLGRAFRWEIPDGRWRPWKLVYIGDPLVRLPLRPPLDRVPPPIARGRRVTLDAASPLVSLSDLRAAADAIRRRHSETENDERFLVERAKPLVALLVEKGDRKTALEAYRVLLRGEHSRREAETLVQRAAALAEPRGLVRESIRDALRVDAKGRRELLDLIDAVLPAR